SIPVPAFEQVTDTGYRVRLSLGEASVLRDQVFGLDLAEITFPGSTPDRIPGGPSLPARTIYLRVPPNVRASVLATSGPPRAPRARLVPPGFREFWAIARLAPGPRRARSRKRSRGRATAGARDRSLGESSRRAPWRRAGAASSPSRFVRLSGIPRRGRHGLS